MIRCLPLCQASQVIFAFSDPSEMYEECCVCCFCLLTGCFKVTCIILLLWILHSCACACLLASACTYVHPQTECWWIIPNILDVLNECSILQSMESNWKITHPSHIGVISVSNQECLKLGMHWSMLLRYAMGALPICIHRHEHTNTHTRGHTYTHTQTHMQTQHTHTHTKYIYADTHINTHTYSCT